jgi:hypothetical protein
VEVPRRHRQNPSTGRPPRRTAIWWSALAALLDLHRSAILAAGTAYLALLSLTPVLMTPYRGDDTMNYNAPQLLTASGQPLLGALAKGLRSQVIDWMTNQGRFFPGSYVWTMSVFSTFQTRLAYKLFLVLLSLVMIGLLARLAMTLTRSSGAAAVMAIGLGATLTLRLWADGMDSFAGLLPFTICLAVGSTLLLLHGRGWVSVVLALVLWVSALLTYEVVIVLTPALCLALWLSRRGTGRSLTLLWPSLVDGLGVLYLRSHAVSEVPAYQANFEFGRVAVTYVKQAAAALPLSQVWYPGSVAPHISRLLVVMTIACVGVPVGVLLSCVHRSRPEPPWRSLGILSLIGGTFWLAPPVLVAITLRWQNELPRGQGYLSVVWGYVGVAMVLVAIWLAVSKRRARSAGAGNLAALVSVTVILAVIAALNVAQSFSIAERFAFPVS